MDKKDLVQIVMDMVEKVQAKHNLKSEAMARGLVGFALESNFESLVDSIKSPRGAVQSNDV